MPGFGVTVPSTLERGLLILCLFLLAFAGWVALWISGDSASGVHHHSVHMESSFKKGFLLFTGSWTVMTVAMMMPTALPILRILHNFAAQRSDRGILIAFAVGGYLIAWMIFGALVFITVFFLRTLIHALNFEALAQMGAPTVIFLAGIFQFTPLKYRCLDQCRSPLSFVLQRWQGRHHRRLAFRLGLDHGVFCVGCCWALMMLMFVVGFESVAWMLLLSAVMAVEKNFSWGRKISAPVGILLIGWSTFLITELLG